MMTEEKINLFGQTNYRNQQKRFGIKPDDRRRHMYIIGKTGMGKTELLKTMIVQDIREGRGVGFVDPHGEAAEELLNFVPQDRMKDVVYFNPADLNHPISFNVMEKVNVEYRHLVASGLMEVFKKIWPDVWSARMEYILHNSILALLEYPTSTLLSINRMLADEEYREKVIDKIKDAVVKAFWVKEYSRYTQRYEVEATAAIQNKIGQFISAPLIRNIIGQQESAIDMRRIMDDGKILILNLSKGRIGEEPSRLLGGLLITKLQLAAMSRVDIPESKRRDFYLYVDEFQNFATESFVNILSEARKYRLSLILAHQYIAQMEETVRDAVFGNVGTLVSLRVGAEDAEFLEKEFFPEFNAGDLVNLPKRQIYLKLIVEGVAGRPFSATTLDAFQTPKKVFREEIIEFSRNHYASKREKIEEEIARWTGDFVRQPQNKAKELTLYDAQCKKCNKWTKVPFKPEPGRPVYCKACLNKMNTGTGRKEPVKEPAKEPARTAPPKEISGAAEEKSAFSLEELLLKKPVSFSAKKHNNHYKQKTAVDKEKLKAALKASLSQEEKAAEQDETVKKGKLKPGQSIRF